jgi:D-threo-aldose 1-dehydrogenase
MKQHQESLQRLGVSYVDSLVIHDLDLGYGTRDQVENYLRELDQGGGARALAELRSAGKIGAVGAGCNGFDAPQHCDEFAKRVAEIVDLDFYLIAGAHYTLLDQRAMDVQFPIMARENMTAVVGTPLASGRLAGGNFYGAKDESPSALKVKEIERVCERFSVDIKAAALQFPLAHPRVCSIIPGSASAAEAAQNKELLDVAIPKGLWRALKEAGAVRGDAPTPADSVTGGSSL